MVSVGSVETSALLATFASPVMLVKTPLTVGFEVSAGEIYSFASPSAPTSDSTVVTTASEPVIHIVSSRFTLPIVPPETVTLPDSCLTVVPASPPPLISKVSLASAVLLA